MKELFSNIKQLMQRTMSYPLGSLIGIGLPLLLCAWPSMTAKAAELPDLGSPSSLILSAQDERQLARGVLGELSQSLQLSQDPVVNEYLHSVGYRIVATHRSSPRSYTFFAIEDNSINAFAVPGGMIGVNTGLILASSSESELAGVMAHEVAHVHLRHIARFIEHMGRVRISNIAGILASVILATQHPQAGSGALAATMAGSTQSLINFTRDNEKEADLVGIQSLAAAGFDPRGMSEFFKKLSQSTRYYGREVPEYLRTHPLTESRLMEAARRASAYPYKQIKDSLQFHLVQARVNVNQLSPTQAVKYYEDTLRNKTHIHLEGARYGYALALLKAQDPKAKKVIDSLIKSNPNQSLYQLTLGNILWQQNKKELAIETLSKALDDHPNNHPTTMNLAIMLIEQKQSDKAINLLHRQSLVRPNSARIYHLLSQAYTQKNDLGASHRYEADYRYHLGDLQGALTQLRMASQYADKHSKQSQKIIARRKEIEEDMARNMSN